MVNPCCSDDENDVGERNVESSGSRASSAPATAAFGTLSKDFTEERVVLVFVHVVNSDMPEKVIRQIRVKHDVQKLREPISKCVGDERTHTFGGCLVWDICALCPDRMDKYSQDCRGRDHV